MTLRSALLSLALCAAPLAATAAHAQSAAEHIALGDREHTDPAVALRHYEAALAAEPNNYEALYKAAEWAVDAGQVASGSAQTALYKKGESYARRAVQVNAGDAEGHFAMAKALGRTAQALGKRDQVKYAGDVRMHALEALKLNPKHPGALHVMGEWNAEIMRLSGVTRFMAKNFLGGKIFDSASWAEAQRYLEEAVAVDPTRLTHRIDLAQVYSDRGNKAKAQEQVEAVLRMPATEAADARYKTEAESLRQKLRG